MIALATILALFAIAAVGLALGVAITGPRAANRMTRKALPESLRQGMTGGLLTSLEGVDSQVARVALLVLAAVAFGVGAWLTLMAA